MRWHPRAGPPPESRLFNELQRKWRARNTDIAARLGGRTRRAILALDNGIRAG